MVPNFEIYICHQKTSLYKISFEIKLLIIYIDLNRIVCKQKKNDCYIKQNFYFTICIVLI